ncbi:universal stress protein [Nitrososphaera viennensis]|uniref:Universal stress protein n=2 Tax=Nitrososphaera viennensis TaxID=1034015 RepID=A0A977IH32_9ARCH|nr:universal stress protein [Nitrososphaera viennensis]AIC15725.1 putative universal stress family protein [Nitrososphaera viennensis EN76]UVS70598.1 universal stress protein [Nitrososphaera viennensis]
MTGAADVSVKKILVPVDGSPVSSKAAQYAVHIAKVEGAKLVIMHVVENVKQGGAIGLQARYGNVRLVEGFRRARIKSAERWMSDIVDDAAKQNVSAKAEILPDDGTHEVGVITEYAKKNNVDLIVMGSRGQSTFKKLLVGSVTNAVINHSPCPVLVVR